MNVSSTLLQQVKDELNISWTDTDTDRRITNIIENAQITLIDKLGITNTSFDFSTVGRENKIFLAYCLYDFNHELSNFDVNYYNEIAQIRSKNLVTEYLEDLEDETS